MPFKFLLNARNCINCGQCMDVCPVNTLDMTRPKHVSPEGKARGEPFKYMMEFPVQVNKCIGCLLCQEECPTQVIKIVDVDKEPEYFKQQGKIIFESEKLPEGFCALSKLTKTHQKKIKSGDPWGHVYTYIPLQREGETKVWKKPGQKQIVRREPLQKE